MKSVKSLNPYKSVIQTMYDIVKAQGCEIFAESRGKVESKEKEGTKFIIQLPNHSS